MVGRQQDGIVALDGFAVPGDGAGAGPVGMLARGADDRDVGIVVTEGRPALLEQIQEDVARGLAVVVHVGLVGQAEDEDLAALDRLAVVVERLRDAVHDMLRHGGIDFARQLDEARVLAVFAGFPREIKRIDRDAVAAESRAGIEGHETEGLRLGGVDDLPHVDVHGGIDDLEFVHQGDVDAAEGVLEELGGLGDAAGGDGHEGLDRDGIEGDGLGQAGGGEAADDLGDGGDHALGIARVFALGGEGQVEIRARLEAGALLQHRAQVLVGGAGVGGGFQHDEGPFFQVGGHGLAGVGDVGDVRLAVLVERGGDADDDGAHVLDPGEVGGGGEGLLVHHGLDVGAGDVLDVAAAAVEGVDLALVDVQAEDGGAGAGKLKGQGQADVAQAHDRDMVVWHITFFADGLNGYSTQVRQP